MVEYSAAAAVYLNVWEFVCLTDLFSLSVGGRVVGDLEKVEVEDVLHLVGLSSSLANNDSHIK